MPLHKVAQTCYDLDIKTREELHSGIIVSERDYMSALSVRIRDNCSAHSQTLKRADETKYGCDTLLQVTDSELTKAVLIEAKWPRISRTPEYKDWDSFKKGVSRFSSQIERQNASAPHPVFEMFLNEDVLGNPTDWDKKGATLVPHHVASTVNPNTPHHHTRKWNRKDLDTVISTAVASKEIFNIGDIVDGMIDCTIGTPVEIKDGYAIFGSSNASISPFHIPVYTKAISESAASKMGFPEKVTEFCKQLGIRTFIALQVDKIVTKQGKSRLRK